MSQPTNELNPAGYPVKSAIGLALFVIGAFLICALLASANDFVGLNSYTVHVPDFHMIVEIICFLLAVPPLPLIHVWLLNQVWRYMAPVDDQGRTLLLAVGVGVAMTALIAIGYAVWLYGADSDLLNIVGVVTTLTVIAGVAVAVRTARRLQFTDSFVRKVGLVTGLVSVIVPVGAFTTRATDSPATLVWPIGILLIFGFIAYRSALGRYLDKLESRATLWQTDRLALEILALFLLMLVPLGVLIGIIEPLFMGAMFEVSRNSTLLWCLTPMAACLLPVIGIPLTGALGLRLYTRWRGQNVVIKKKAAPLELHTTPLFGGNAWFRMLFWHTVIWLGTSIIAIGLYTAIMSVINPRLLR